MSATTDVIEAARAVVGNRDPEDGGYLVNVGVLLKLDAALKAYDARRAEMSAMQITGGG
jgi:hypothetical protein